MTWLRRVLTWRPGWPEPGHWCGACQVGRELDKKLDDELALLEEAWR